jgi:hypothetical protein
MANRSAQVASRALLAGVVFTLISACTSGSSSKPPAPTTSADAALALADVRWNGDAQDGFWKVAERVENHGTTVTGASITCSLVDAAGAISASADGTVKYLAPSKSAETFVEVEHFRSEPASANCSVSAIPAVPPKKKPPAKPTLYPSAIAFFDADHGILGGQMATRRCFDHTDCPGIIQTTSDGGRMWHTTARLPHVVGWVTVAEGRAWATVGDCTPEQCTSSALLRSDDLGKTWRQVSSARVHQPSFATTPSAGRSGRGTSRRVRASLARPMEDARGPLRTAHARTARRWPRTSRRCRAPTSS